MMQWKKMMTKEEIIELSTKCRIKPDDNCSALVRVFIFDFAREVEKHVREECAKTAENISSYDRDEPEVSIAKAIRARKQDA